MPSIGAFVNLVLKCDKSLEEKEKLLIEFLEELQQTESLKKDFQAQLLEKDLIFKDEKIMQLTKEYEKVEMFDKRFY
jgi:hypothetical protein